MTVDVTTLKIITDDTLKAIRKYDVVTPDLFKDTFVTQAKKRNVPIDLDELSDKTVENTLHKIFSIEEQTKENTQILQENLNLATTAIKEQDEKLLDIVQSQMQELTKKISHLEEQVYLDELTKAYNRKWLFEKVLSYEKFNNDGTIIFIDVDKFKTINDTYGHITGDKILALITKISKSIENANTIRYGGDEFIVIANNANKEEYLKTMEQLSNNLSKKLFKIQDKTFHVGISYGVVEFKKGDSFQEILEMVDELMYTHKKAKA